MTDLPGRVDAILIAGPTASGKSALAVRLARERGGVIINADSMQVYRELRVLTARPSKDDEAQVPHLLYGHVPAREPYSAGRFAREAATALGRAREDGRTPIIVGGTGLYFKTLLEGLSPIPGIPSDVRAHWRLEAERLGAEALYARLAARDPDMAGRLRPTDPQRIVRALEVLEATGRSLAYWQKLPGAPILAEADCERLLVSIDRETLYMRSDERFERMMEQGALEEAQALAELGLSESLPSMRALGVRPLLKLLRGEADRETAIAHAKAETRQYIKRQLTWLKRNMSSWTTVYSQ